MLAIINNIDLQILQYIQESLRTPIGDRVMIFFTTLGDKGAIWILISIILLLTKKYRRVGIISITALFLATLLGEGVLKHVVQRLRPFAQHPGFKLFIKAPSSIYSFPSGHTTSSFAVAGVLAVYFKKYAVLIFSIASLIAISRLYLFVHYPSDVAAGIVLGLVCSKVAIKTMAGQKTIGMD